MPVQVQIMIIIMGALAFSSTVWALVHFKLKKKSWRCEAAMRSWDPSSMRCVTMSTTHEHSWPKCRNASTLQNACSPPDEHRKRTEVGDHLFRGV